MVWSTPCGTWAALPSCSLSLIHILDTLKGADDIVIRLRAEDMDQSDAITAALKGVKVTFQADPSILMGGLTAVSP